MAMVLTEMMFIRKIVRDSIRGISELLAPAQRSKRQLANSPPCPAKGDIR